MEKHKIAGFQKLSVSFSGYLVSPLLIHQIISHGVLIYIVYLFYLLNNSIQITMKN